MIKFMIVQMKQVQLEPSLSGCRTDDVSLAGSPVTTKNMEQNHDQQPAYTISGADAGKYTLGQPTLSANITAKP
jgi:hypothetical protein